MTVTVPRNYDISLLTFAVGSPGFIIGEGIIGVTPLGPEVGLSFIGKDFTSLVVNQPCIVEDGLFVHREVESCTLTTTNPAHLDLKGQRLWIQYATKTLFLGTIVGTSMTEFVDKGRDHLPGNTAVRTHRVTLRATQESDGFATQLAPTRAFTTETTAARIQSYLATPNLGVDGPPYADVDAEVTNNGGGLVAQTTTTLADAQRTLQDTFRDLLKRTNRYYYFSPTLGRLDTESSARPASGGVAIDSGLRFTDEPSLIGGDTDRDVSYTERQVSEDPSMFCTGVTVTANGTPHGPWLSAGSLYNRNDAEIDLGTLTDATRLAKTVRNFVATLPLKSRPSRFTSRIIAPYQSTHQVQNRLPGIATLRRDLAPEEDFEDASLNIAVSGTWARSTQSAHSGTWSLRSATITHSQTTDAVVTVPTGAKTVQFWYRVSSEADFDFFRFFIDGVQKFEASGITGWVQSAEYDVSTASTLTFRYLKDSTASEGEDAAYIDDVSFDPDELVSIIGIQHTITPDGWIIDYDCAPPHLLTRVGDFDPSPPRSLTATQPFAGGAVTLTWLTPDFLPVNGPQLYRQVRWSDGGSNHAGGMEPSDNAFPVLLNEAVTGEKPGELQTLVVPFSSLNTGLAAFFVQYTSFPTPGTGVFDSTALIGQPAIKTLTLT